MIFLRKNLLKRFCFAGQMVWDLVCAERWFPHSSQGRRKWTHLAISAHLMAFSSHPMPLAQMENERPPPPVKRAVDSQRSYARNHVSYRRCLTAHRSNMIHKLLTKTGLYCQVGNASPPAADIPLRGTAKSLLLLVLFFAVRSKEWRLATSLFTVAMRSSRLLSFHTPIRREIPAAAKAGTRAPRSTVRAR